MISRMLSILSGFGYEVYSKSHQLNIVGMRSRNTIANRFDDELHVFYKNRANNWEYKVYKITTDPGTFWLKNPYTPQGTAILAQGQYQNAYAIGLHRGLYPALVQVGPVTIIRDYNRNNTLDFNNGNKITGAYGINIHRANQTGRTFSVDVNSAGCQVFRDANDFADFMQLCAIHAQMHGNRFTFTLIDFRAMKREILKRIGFAVTVALGVWAGILLKPEPIKKRKKERPDILNGLVNRNWNN